MFIKAILKKPIITLVFVLAIVAGLSINIPRINIFVQRKNWAKEAVFLQELFIPDRSIYIFRVT